MHVAQTYDNVYAQRFSNLMYLGVAVNMLFVIPMLFAPQALLGLLHMTVPQPVLWVRAAGLLLLEISILYLPIAASPYRYASLAWLVLPVMRGGGSSFFLIAVLFFRQEPGFASIAIVDTFFLVTQLYYLHRALQTAPPAALNLALRTLAAARH